MSESLISPKLERDLTDAAIMIASVNWTEISQPGEGACIPISYGLSEFLNLRGRPARPVETLMRVRDSINARYTEIQPTPNGFLGHMVVIMPTQGLLLDGSLWTQNSKVLANFELPKLMMAKWRRDFPAYRNWKRLTFEWNPDLKAKHWKQRKWPWEMIKRTMATAEKDLR